MKFISHASGSSGNLYQVVSGNDSILIEAGLPVKKIKAALGFRLSGIGAALISHSHGDHAQGVAGLIQAGIDCHMTRETADALGVAGHRVQILEQLKQFTAGRFTVLPFGTHHDCAGSVGFLISDGVDKLLFATDTFYIKHRFQGLTMIAVECNYSMKTIPPDIDPAVRQRLYSSHFSLENVIKFLKANDLSKVKEIHLIHLSNGNSDEEMFIREVQKTTGCPVYAA